MSDNVKESLSVLMDGESSELEARRLIQQVDDETAGTWARYCAARSVMHGESISHAGFDLSVRVSDALQREPALACEFASPRAELFRGVWKSLASAAVAATVTGVVIFGAQSYQGVHVGAAASQAAFVLPGPSPMSPELLRAQYGRSADSVGRIETDVIRLSYGMEHYINQHHALIRSAQPRWTAHWLPKGFEAIRHSVMPDSEVILYSNGRTAITVTIEPNGRQRAEAGAMQNGETVALGKPVANQFVTVVGDIPLMIADRVATSVDRLAR